MNLSTRLMSWEHRRIGSCILAMLLAGTVVPAQVSNTQIKLGLWETQVSTTNTISLPPEMEARIAAMPPAQQDMVRSRMGGAKPVVTTSKSCVAKQESIDSMLNDAQQRAGMKCAFTNRSETASGGSFDITCTGQQGTFKGHTDIHRLDDEHVSATTHMTGEASSNGSNTSFSAESKLDSKYVGADCGNVKPSAQ